MRKACRLVESIYYNQHREIVQVIQPEGCNLVDEDCDNVSEKYV